MTVNIDTNLNLNITDFLLLQEISEMKLNRQLDLTGNEIFYDSYTNPNIDEATIKKYFYATVGSTQYLNPDNGKIEYIGGAGAYTKISQTQADYFLDNYTIIDYYGNDNTGFSATTFKNKTTGEITISFRSTEFTEDYYKDAAGADNEISDNGTAIAQNIALVNYLNKLKTPDSEGISIINDETAINLTGYSLGGHLASSAYQYLTADNYEVKQLYVFNGPGVGNILTPGETNSTTVTANFGLLEQDLLNYTQIINMFNILKVQNIQTIEDALTFVNTNSNNQLLKNFFNTISSSDLFDLMKDNSNNTLLTNATLQIYNSTTNSYLSHESELLRENNDQNNHDDSYSKSTIYNSDLYKKFKNYIIQKYTMSKAAAGGNTNNNTATNEQTFILASQSEKTGIYNPSLFSNNALWLNGQASVNNYDYLANDYNFVSNSNNYGDNVDIIIEDRPETEDGITRLPVIDSISKTLNGDFGNTHSITLLNKTLNLMATLAKLEGKSFINVSNYSSLISSSTKERATHFYLQEDGTKGTGDYNAIANIINTLSTLILNDKPQIMFDNTIGGWANIDKINQLDQIEQKLINSNISNLNFISLYNIKSSDMSRTNFNTTQYDYISKDELINKAKTNIAYRYALDNLNTFVVDGFNYSNYVDSTHSDEWYSSRADILLKIIDSNVENLNNYVSSGYSDNNLKNSNVNVYVNDNKQDLHFYSYINNTNVTYKKYNSNSYYSNSQSFNELSSLDNSLLNTLFKVSNKIKLSDVAGAYPVYSALAAMAFIAAPITVPVGLSYISYNYNSNFSKLTNLTFNTSNPSISVANYFSTLFKGEDITKYIGNITHRDSLSIDKNIYFLDNSTSDYISNNYKNRNENVFINVDKNILYSYIQGNSNEANQYFNTTKYHIKYGESSIQSVNDIVLTHDVKLGDGDDYIEIDDDGESTITSTSGKKNYYLKNSLTTITDPDKTGTITLDGVLLNGGKIFEDNGVSDPSKRVQVVYDSTNLDANGNPTTYQITYEFTTINTLTGESKGFLITNEKTGHQVVINGMSNFGNGSSFQFNSLNKTNQSSDLTISSSNFSNNNQYSSNNNYIQRIIDSVYGSSTDFNALFNINIGISNQNMVITRDFNHKQDLFIYDKTNPSNMYTIADFFDSNGDIRIYNYSIDDGNGGITQANSSFSINNTPIYTLLQYNPTLSAPGFDSVSAANQALGYSGYEITTSLERTMYYSPFAKYYIDNSIIGSTGFKKDGNDLIVYSLNYKEAGSTTIKNYFSFDHSNTTNFYIHRYGENIALSSHELITRTAIRLDENSSNYVMDDNSYKTVVSGFGDDHVVGTSANETFISQTVYVPQNDLVSRGYSDGNDTFTGGGGADIYSFSGNFGYDTITDFNNDSTIYIDNSYQSTDYQFLRQGNDLIIYKDLDTNITQDYSQVTVKDYFTNINYNSNSRIIFTRNQEHYSQLYNDNTYIPESYYYFDPSEIQDFNTTDLSKTSDEILEQKAKDNSENSIDTTKLSTSHIKGNDLDNTIIIRNNDTVIHSNQTAELTDGDDTYIIDIAANEAIPFNHNNYRTTIEFGFNSGHDTLLNAQFKQMAQYGDIIDLKNIDSSSLTVNALKNDSDVVVGFNLILQDGSSLLVAVNDLSDTTVDMVKTNTGILRLSNLLSMSSPSSIMGDSMNNSFDLSSSVKSVSINGLDGNDIIVGGQADDIIEGGKGFDKFQFTKGYDTYKFGIGSDVDTFDMTNLTSDDILAISAKFLVDSSYKTNGVSYAYNASENEGYFKLSESDGVVFSNVSWSNFVLLINNINVQFTDGTNPDMNVDYTNDFPFIPSVKIINGTTGTDYLQANGVYSSVIYGKEGNDTIVSPGNTNHTINYLIGGKGSDTITANDGDFVIVKDGDGADTIKTTDRSFVLEILHSTPRLVNSQETLFDVSAVSSSSNDLKLKYGGSTDTITIKDYFASNNNEITVALYDSTNDKTYVYDNLTNILSSMGLTKSYLLSHGATTVYKNNTSADFIGSTGQLIGGEIAYQYLNGSYLQDQSKINHIIDNQLNGNPLQNKIYS